MEERPPEFRDPSPPFETPPPPPSPPASPADIIPWERPGVNAFEGFGRTIKMLMTSPTRAFESMPVDASFGRPLVFGILVSWIGVLAGTFWNLLLRGWIQEMAPWADERWNEVSGTMRIVSAMVAPVWIPIALLIGAAIQHLFLFVVGGAKHGFAATFRVQCYAAAPMVLAIVPACGSIAGLVGSFLLAILGLSAAHRISRGKAAAAVLLPLLLCCACIGIVIALFGAAIMAGLGINR